MGLFDRVAALFGRSSPDPWPAGMVNEAGRRRCPTPSHALHEIGQASERLRQLYGDGPTGATPRQHPGLMQVLSAYSSALGMFMPPGATETLALKQSYLNLVPLLRQDIVTMADYLLADAGVSGLASSIAGELQGSTDAELKEAGDSLAEGIEAANRLREMGF